MADAQVIVERGEPLSTPALSVRNIFPHQIYIDVSQKRILRGPV